jgi:nucleoside-diphosphate-sugar epimerase
MYKNESVLVTGGTGFLGKAVVANLKDNGYQNVHAIGSSFDLTTAEDTKLAYKIPDCSFIIILQWD